MSDETELTPLTVGWIPYNNLRPLKRELWKLCGKQLHFRTGHPTEVNKLLMEKRVPLAPSSSICLLKNHGLELALPLGVASAGAVQSVYLGLSGDITHLADLIKKRIFQIHEIVTQALCQYPNHSRQAAKFIWGEL